MKKAHKILFTVGVICGLLFIGYQQLSPSQKRFVQETLRQAPYLIPRYFV
jgi:hypothetical protein